MESPSWAKKESLAGTKYRGSRAILPGSFLGFGLQLHESPLGYAACRCPASHLNFSVWTGLIKRECIRGDGVVTILLSRGPEAVALQIESACLSGQWLAFSSSRCCPSGSTLPSEGEHDRVTLRQSDDRQYRGDDFFVLQMSVYELLLIASRPIER